MTLLLAIMLIAGTNLSWWWLLLVIPAWLCHCAYHSNTP